MCSACNGGIQGGEFSAAIRETVDEVADSVHAAYAAGASMERVHARDRETLWKGATTPSVWCEVNRKTRERSQNGQWALASEDPK